MDDENIDDPDENDEELQEEIQEETQEDVKKFHVHINDSADGEVYSYAHIAIQVTRIQLGIGSP